MRIAATLPASDIERAKDWYGRVLQIEPVDTTEDGSYWFELGDTRFLVYSSQFAGSNQATAAGIEVDDVATAVAEFRSRGAVFEEYDFGEDFRTVEGVRMPFRQIMSHDAMGTMVTRLWSLDARTPIPEEIFVLEEGAPRVPRAEAPRPKVPVDPRAGVRRHPR